MSEHRYITHIFEHLIMIKYPAARIRTFFAKLQITKISRRQILIRLIKAYRGMIVGNRQQQEAYPRYRYYRHGTKRTGISAQHYQDRRRKLNDEIAYYEALITNN